MTVLLDLEFADANAAFERLLSAWDERPLGDDGPRALAFARLDDLRHLIGVRYATPSEVLGKELGLAGSECSMLTEVESLYAARVRIEQDQFPRQVRGTREPLFTG